MAAENFLTYPVVDPNSRFTVTSSKVTHTNLDRNETAYVYLDKGADFFDGDFVHLVTVYMTALSNGSVVFAWGVANDLNDFRTIKNAGGDWLGLSLVGIGAGVIPTIVLSENDGGSVFTDSFSGSLATPYYLRIVRDETVGTYGTLYCYIYSDVARTTLVDTLSITLHTDKKDFRYVYGVSSDNFPDTPITGSGYSADLNIEGGESSVLPEVTTEFPTSIEASTATGNGHIVSEGLADVTEHGHCWATTVDPTTADSKTTEGAGSVGSFTSSITGLTPGTKYFVRAYATNSFGTSYGEGFSWVSGASYSILSKGNLAVKVTQLHYVGKDGREYSIQGNPL